MKVDMPDLNHSSNPFDSLALPTQVKHLISLFVNLVESHIKGSPVHLFYHADADGLCAAVSAQNIVKHVSPNSPLSYSWIATHQFDFEHIKSFIHSFSNYTIICFDINFTSVEGFIDNIIAKSDNKVIIIDDHVTSYETTESSNISFLNPNIMNGNYAISLAPSLFGYLAALCLNLKLPSWLPAIGLFADRQLDTWRQVLSGPIPNNSEIFKSVKYLSSNYLNPYSDNNSDPAFDFLINEISRGSGWQDFMHSIEQNNLLMKSVHQVDTALEGELDLHSRRGPVEQFYTQPPLFIYKQQSEYRFTNLISSRLMSSHPSGITFVYRCDEEYCYFELRAGDNVGEYDIVSILKSVAEVVPLRNYGGHPRAAGGACNRNFISEVIKLYAENT